MEQDWNRNRNRSRVAGWQGGRAAELFGKVTGGKREGLGVGGGKKANAKGDKCGRDLVQRNK